MEWYLAVLRKYAQFSGRSRRKEYWYFYLFNLIISLALLLIDIFVQESDSTNKFRLLSGLYGLAAILPSWAVRVRRLHDTNHSGWWLPIGLVPLIGTIVLIVFLVEDSQTRTIRMARIQKIKLDPGV